MSNNIEGGKSVGPGAALGRVLEPLRMNDGFQVVQRNFKQLVDYNEVEFLGTCVISTAAFLSRTSMTSGLSSPRRSRRERSSSQLGGRMNTSTALANSLLDLQCALEVDFQDHVAALPQCGSRSLSREVP